MNPTISFQESLPLPLPQPRTTSASTTIPVAAAPVWSGVETLPRPVPHRRWPWILLSLLAVAMIFLGTLVLSFLPGREIRVLSRAVMASAPGDWERQLAIGVGRLPTGLAKAALAWVDLPPEARAALKAFQSADVALYRRQGSSTGNVSPTFLTTAADQLARQGWETLVRVQDGDQQVHFFTRAPGLFASQVRLCGLVFHDDQWVLISATADLEPLIDLAATHLSDLKF